MKEITKALPQACGMAAALVVIAGVYSGISQTLRYRKFSKQIKLAAK